MKRISVLLVDDHALVRLGLKTLIDDQADMNVTGEAGTAAEALQAVEALHPQVVLMDIRRAYAVTQNIPLHYCLVSNP
jgi:DNA-binding NarL/FixJ family response regulator